MLEKSRLPLQDRVAKSRRNLLRCVAMKRKAAVAAAETAAAETAAAAAAVSNSSALVPPGAPLVCCSSSIACCQQVLGPRVVADATCALPCGRAVFVFAGPQTRKAAATVTGNFCSFYDGNNDSTIVCNVESYADVSACVDLVETGV